MNEQFSSNPDSSTPEQGTGDVRRRIIIRPDEGAQNGAKREMHGMVNIAVRAARRAGELMVRQLNRLETLTVAEKGRNEFVTQVDRAAEEAIIEVIKDHYPENAILAEESRQGAA